MITVRQCKAARALLGWNQGDLADRAGISVSALGRWESGQTISSHAATLRDVQLALEGEGVVFIGLTGVDKPETRADRARGRPPNFADLSAAEQREIDRDLDIIE